MKFKKGDLVKANEKASFKDIGIVEVERYRKDDPEIVVVKRISKKRNVWFQGIHESFLELVKRADEEKIKKLCILWWKWNWEKGVSGDDFAYEFYKLFGNEIDEAFNDFKKETEKERDEE
ncbi:MAG: hypothetical protein ACP6IP_10820 [Candidatus Njordarchaeia archaeon]